jgi:hypothetical protein
MRPPFHRTRRKSIKLPDIYRYGTSQETETMLIPHAHLANMAEGRGDPDMFLTLATRTMIGAVLTRFLEDEDPLATDEIDSVFRNGVMSLIAIGERYQRVHKIGVNGNELIALKMVLNLTDDLQKVTTRRQQKHTLQIVSNFIGSFDQTLSNLKKLHVNIVNK